MFFAVRTDWFSSLTGIRVLSIYFLMTRDQEDHVMSIRVMMLQLSPDVE